MTYLHDNWSFCSMTKRQGYEVAGCWSAEMKDELCQDVLSNVVAIEPRVTLPSLETCRRWIVSTSDEVEQQVVWYLDVAVERQAPYALMSRRDLLRAQRREIEKSQRSSCGSLENPI